MARLLIQLRDLPLGRALDDLDLQLEDAFNQCPRTVVVDISAVPPASSTTISALLWVRRRCSAQGIEMLLKRPSRRSVETLTRVGVLEVVQMEG